MLGARKLLSKHTYETDIVQIFYAGTRQAPLLFTGRLIKNHKRGLSQKYKAVHARFNFDDVLS